MIFHANYVYLRKGSEKLGNLQGKATTFQLKLKNGRSTNLWVNKSTGQRVYKSTDGAAFLSPDNGGTEGGAKTIEAKERAHFAESRQRSSVAQQVNKSTGDLWRFCSAHLLLGRWGSVVLLLIYHSTNLSFGKAQTGLALLSLNRFVHSNRNSRCPS